MSEAPEQARRKPRNPPNKRKVMVTEELAERLGGLFAEGKSMDDIHAQTGVSVPYLYVLRKRWETHRAGGNGQAAVSLVLGSELPTTTGPEGIDREFKDLAALAAILKPYTGHQRQRMLRYLEEDA